MRAEGDPIQRDACLGQLEQALSRDFERLNHPPTPWLPERMGPDGRPLADVLLVGAGMNGLAAAFALRRLGLHAIRHVDAAPGREASGPWLTYARMTYLRSPKHLTGPAMGLANLTFRAWWEAQFGAAGWASLGFVTRQDWARYLAWYARVTGAQISWSVRLLGLDPTASHVTARLMGPDGPETVHARTVVLATGREGQARPRIPPPFAPFYGCGVQHSAEPVDFDALAGRRVAVVGLAASAFDNACAAAEAGAQVTLIGRAGSVPRLNKMRWTVFPGFAHGFPDLPAPERLAWLRHVAAHRIAPPRHTVQRAARAGVRLKSDAEILSVRGPDPFRIATNAGEVTADHVILGTGFAFDLAGAAELATLAPQIRCFRDNDAQGPEDAYLDCPDLGPGFEFQPMPGAPEGMGRIRCYTHAAQPSLGNLANDIPHSGEGADRLARHVARDLFVEAAPVLREGLEAYEAPELHGDEWPSAFGQG
ncbi:MAG: NAD(P)/FAD-dependent oxidoreductase [Pseudomonadota bacterium]